MRARFPGAVFACAALAAGCGNDRADTHDADAAIDGSSPIDAAMPPPGKVGMFIAQGMLGRTIVSCDDGETWVGNHSWDIDGDDLMCKTMQQVTCSDTCSWSLDGGCVQEQCCIDTPGVPEGVAFGDTAIVGAWGHGQPGAIRTTTDGLSWTTTEISHAFSIAYGDGRFVAAGNSGTSWSTDGITWTPGGDTSFDTTGSPVRAFGFAPYDRHGRFVAVSAGNGLRDILVSSDGGMTWWRPSEIPGSCAIGVGGNGGDILGRPDGLLLIVDSNGTACESVDGGDHWSVHSTGLTQIASHGMWTGSEFVYWGQNTMIRSSDGISWTPTPMTTQTRIGPTARSDVGTFVAIPYVYDGYDRQYFLRSTDGRTWDRLDPPAFFQSHPIFSITFGYAEPSMLCPLQ